MKTALFIGRFQPIHLGHVDAIKQILDKGFKNIIIGLGSSQEKNTPKNPFDLSQRESLVREVLLENFPKLKFQFLAIPDFADSKKWLEFILTNSKPFEAVFTGNPYVEFCFKESDKKIYKLNINLPIKATNIRKQVAQDSDLWKETVPSPVAKKLESKDWQNSFKQIFKLDQKQMPNDSILIIEKYTDLEFLEKQKFADYNNLKSKKELEKNHFQHLKVKLYILELLQDLGFNYKLLKEDQSSSDYYSKYKTILTLGGDGTFLHAAKMAINQLMIGVNTNPDKSVGLLTKFNIDSINRALCELAKNSFKIEKWHRLAIKINNKKQGHLALNEVFVGVPEIYKSSLLEVKIGQKNGFFSGNGLIVSTFKGSTGFYKSANGKPIQSDNFGLATLLPFLKTGTIGDFEILDSGQKIIIVPHRANHVVVFDGDDSRKLKLKQGDRLEVFLDLKKSLKVLT